MLTDTIFGVNLIEIDEYQKGLPKDYIPIHD